MPNVPPRRAFAGLAYPAEMHSWGKPVHGEQGNICVPSFEGMCVASLLPNVSATSSSCDGRPEVRQKKRQQNHAEKPVKNDANNNRHRFTKRRFRLRCHCSGEVNNAAQAVQLRRRQVGCENRFQSPTGDRRPRQATAEGYPMFGSTPPAGAWEIFPVGCLQTRWIPGREVVVCWG